MISRQREPDRTHVHLVQTSQVKFWNSEPIEERRFELCLKNGEGEPLPLCLQILNLNAQCLAGTTQKKQVGFFPLAHTKKFDKNTNLNKFPLV